MKTVGRGTEGGGVLGTEKGLVGEVQDKLQIEGV